MLGRSNCCAPQKTCYSSTYDDYEELNHRGGERGGFNTCRPSFKENLCNRIKRVQESSKILENVLDISSTLVKIMCVCGIHECKANKALDVIIYAFMHFDEVAEHPGGKCKKRIRKEEFYNDLMRDCGMTKAEAKLTYSIVKCAFKAFYHKQVVNKYDAGFVDECEWKNAANRTINAFATSGASKSEIELTGRRILCAYENYMCRLQSKKQAIANQQEEGRCTCNRGKRDSFGNGNFGGGFSPCQPCPPLCQEVCPHPEPPLCGELCCQIVCPPGSNIPQLVCKDACGRTFLKVDGNRVNYDPFIMECEAKRAAMNVCPPCGEDHIRSVRDSLDVHRPKDTDSCDAILAEICKDEKKKGDICDEKDEICDTDDDRGNGDQYARDRRGEDSSDGHDSHGSRGKESGYEDRRNQNRGRDRERDRDGERDQDRNRDRRRDRGSSFRANKESDRGNQGRDRETEQTKSYRSRQPDILRNEAERIVPLKRSSSPPGRDRREGGKGNASGEMSIEVKFTEHYDGHKMTVDMQGYGSNDGYAPDDITALTVITNDNPPLDFECTSGRSQRTYHADERSVKSVRSDKDRTVNQNQSELPSPNEPPPPANSTPRGSQEGDLSGREEAAGNEAEAIEGGGEAQ